MTLTLASLILTLLGMLLGLRAISAAAPRIAFAALCWLQLFLLGAYWLANHLSGVGIDESVIYHLQEDMQGMGLVPFLDLIIFSALYLLAIFVLSGLIVRFSRAAGVKAGSGWRRISGFVALCAALAFNPASHDIVELYMPSALMEGMEIPVEYQAVNHLPATREPKNLVVLYLESVEDTYFDDALFPDLLPELSALKETAISFSDIRQVHGTSWTIAGMTASQCGIPLVTPGSGNSQGGLDQFLPKAICLGDLLAAHNYHLNYMGGATLSFAGKGRFYASHGFTEIDGRDELLPAQADPDYHSTWGLYDDTLYDLATERLHELHAAPAPFGLFLLTLDTHHPDGHMSRSCADVVYQNGDNPILNSVHCTDRLAAGFIRRFLASEAAEDTVLVVLSDHLAMPNTATTLLQQGTRRNLVMLFTPDQPSAQINKPGSLLDVAPTIKQAIGFDSPSLGLGRSLLADVPTLVESQPDTDEWLRTYRPLFQSMWSYPDIKEGILIDPAAKTVQLGQRQLDYPVLFLLNEQQAITEVYFNDANPATLTREVSNLTQDQPFIWIDECRKQSTRHADEGECLLFGHLGQSAPMTPEPVNEQPLLSYDRVRQAMDSPALDATRYTTRQQQLTSIEQTLRTREHQFAAHDTDPMHDAEYLLHSFSGPGVTSAVQNLGTDQTLPLQRGLTLVGFSAREDAAILAHVDTCQLAEQSETAEPGVFRHAIDNAEQYSAFAVIAHDSAQCGAVDFSPLFASTPFTQWGNIGFRAPYIGIMTRSGKVQEHVGRFGENLSVHAEHFISPEP
ncbi:sulfatase-like hydrolase/transferase [Halopseudomonas salegens]|uniref:Phosphoglycerol transferase n=1 Tax=Halopseudomonas salegens TaxID=1434072 RepID=A0A1H2FNW4_9GAMM|nr:sulfatase-like hydrolase/transferase [Halopseudomonas salegens]SDU09002.1 phosphoglycerol transferase [Halopseudomonas salegens]